MLPIAPVPRPPVPTTPTLMLAAPCVCTPLGNIVAAAAAVVISRKVRRVTGAAVSVIAVSVSFRLRPEATRQRALLRHESKPHERSIRQPPAALRQLRIAFVPRRIL